MIGYIVGCLGVWIFADGVASLWQYTRPERKDNQSWLRDHSLRIFRMLCALALVYLGALLI